MFLLGFILYGTLHLLDLIDYFLFHGGEIFEEIIVENFPNMEKSKRDKESYTG